MPPDDHQAAYVVIGSGPAGVACAHALAERGFEPLVVDAGRRLDATRQRAARLSSGRHGIDPEFAADLEAMFPVDVDRLPLKPAFGEREPKLEGLWNRVHLDQGLLRGAVVAVI